MSEREHYTASQLTPDEAELEHLAEEARKYHMAECASCEHLILSETHFDTKCKIHPTKPKEEKVRQCPSFRPYSISYTKNVIRLNNERKEAYMRKLAEESEKRHKEVFSHVRAMRVMARLVAHEVNKKLMV